MDLAPIRVFVGFELDIIEMVVRLLEAKLQCSLSSVQEWARKKACKRSELESLLGYLLHVTTVVHPGHTFVWRIIELLLTAKAQDHWIHLNVDVRADLYWWLFYAEKWSGAGGHDAKKPVAQDYNDH